MPDANETEIYDEIDDTAKVSEGEAIAELSRHSIGEICVLATGELYSVDQDDIIAEPLDNGDFLAQDILTWLGY